MLVIRVGDKVVWRGREISHTMIPKIIVGVKDVIQSNLYDTRLWMCKNA